MRRGQRCSYVRLHADQDTIDDTTDRAPELRLQPMLRDTRRRPGPVHRRRLLRPATAVLAVPAAGSGRLRSAAAGDRRWRAIGPHPARGADVDRLRHGARGDAARASRRSSPTACGCARCATAVSPRRSGTATAAGTMRCGPAMPPRRRCCATTEAAVVTMVNESVTTPADVLAAIEATGADDRRAGPAEIEAARRLPADLLDELRRPARSGSLAPPATAESKPTCPPRCASSRRSPGPTPRWPGP